MSAEIRELSGHEKRIVLVLNLAVWYVSLKLRYPEHVHLLDLPAFSPEPQQVKHLWPLTNTTLVNQQFATTPAPGRGAAGTLRRLTTPSESYSLCDAGWMFAL
jgi:hypothetical protein